MEDHDKTWAYARSPAFIESLKRAQIEVAAWPEEKRISIESFRRFHSEQCRRAYAP